MNKRKFLIAAALGMASNGAFAASGEMGDGIPNFGVYSSATGSQLVVWSLTDSAVPFPSGCTSIKLTPETMGIEAYKMAFATMTAAKIAGSRVRFYAHADRDGGCGVDYVELQ